MAFWVYVLRCADGTYHTGPSHDIERRIAERQTGGYCDFTSRRRPVRLMWFEQFPSRIEALEAERPIKPWSRAKAESLFRGDWAAFSHVAKPSRNRPSTSLGTNGDGGASLYLEAHRPTPSGSSEVGTRPPRKTDGRP